MGRLVILESPYAGAVAHNLVYARRCMRDSFLRGESPFASHLLYTQDGILDDDVPAERAFGIEAGLSWGTFADATVVYTDFGISAGMDLGIARARKEGRDVEMRKLGDGFAKGLPEVGQGKEVGTPPWFKFGDKK